ncbi:hypothetical protein FALBO_257 [Fusarium albosuccineum]|uniref:Uncharacterized protein n=1 Tax=Fusarium albosuccineum TaxID=1237068 RepID=A0A8H4PIF0_9HYPO|nr:hypothetical protein FALBO_257 [Fusarium albosuccineum]
MASNDPPKKPAPPAAFLHAQTRARKRKTRSHGSNASTVSRETDADDEGMSVAAETLSNVNEHESRTMEPDVSEPGISTELEASAQPEILAEVGTYSESEQVVDQQGFSQDHIMLRPAWDPVLQHAQAGIPASGTGPSFTQNNTQNTHNNQNSYTFNLNTNHYSNTAAADSSSGGGGGGGGRRRVSGLLPCGGCPLVYTIVSVVVLVAAIYGAATMWNNTISALYGVLWGLVRLLTLGYVSTGSFADLGACLDQRHHSHRRISKAVEDLDMWMSRLEECAGDDRKDRIPFFAGLNSAAFGRAGRTNDFWVILSEDILTLERQLRRRFGPLYKDLSQISGELRLHPATACWRKDHNTSAWAKFCAVLSFGKNKTFMEVLSTYHDRIKALDEEVRSARRGFPNAVGSIRERLKIIQQGTCQLRNEIETAGNELARKNDDPELSDGVAAVTLRGNLLCDLFLRTERRISSLEERIGSSGDISADRASFDEALERLAVVKPVTAEDIRRTEESLARWVGKLAKQTGKLYQLHDLGT